MMKASSIHARYIRNSVGQFVYMISPAHKGGGTGFAITAPSGKTYIVTNDHICVGSENGFVYLMLIPELRLEIPAKIIERSQTTDLCLVEAPPYQVGLRLASGTFPGDQVQAVGHPGLMLLTVSNVGEIIQVGPTTLSDRVGKSRVNNLRYLMTVKCDTSNKKFKKFKYKDGTEDCLIHVPSAFFTTVLVQPGSSGSPLVNFYGDVVGVIAGMDTYGWGVAVSLGELAQFLSNK